MTDSRLEAWVKGWLADYDLKHDNVLAALRGASTFSRSDVETIIRWKYYGVLTGRQQYRLRIALERLGAFPPHGVSDITRRAIADSDDGGALQTVREIPGIGAAFGSAILMTQNPDRYTVWDVRAPRSLEALGYANVSDDSLGCWRRYLHACRDISARTGQTLRDVDRALFCSNGNLNLPVGSQ